ncbi:MAG: class I SAM-dependent methyltransferase [Elusimicrobia bacterium]|nr:class I SAM-dependent methyltransferase [Elusimicrobiota bacterium]
MDHAERVRSLFDYVAAHKEYRIDLRRFIDGLDVVFGGKTVLEAGCGQGLTACHIASTKGARSVVGFDMSPVSIERADQLRAELHLGNVRFAVASIEEFRSPERYDVVCAFGVLQYVEDVLGCIDRLCGHLNSGPEATLILTMSEPTAMSRVGSIVQGVLSKLPTACIPPAVKIIALVLSPLNINGRYGDRPLENLVREALFPPSYTFVPAATVTAHLEKVGFTASAGPFLGIDGMYTVTARRRV